MLTPQDILETVRHLIELKNGRGSVDDIDHLGNRRVRAVGELMENQYRIGLVRMERAIKERMSMSQEIDTLMPHDLINAKPVSRGGEGVLRQLAALAVHGPDEPALARSRTSVVSRRSGPAVSRASARASRCATSTPTHYGRICPIETPEGPNIGLIASLSTFARVNEYGFVETPYRRSSDGRVTDEVQLVLGARRGGEVHRPGDRPTSTRRASSARRLVSRSLQRRLPDGHARDGRADGRRAEPDGVRRRRARAVPRARRREPRAHGRQHAAPGRAAHPHARAARRHRHGGPRSRVDSGVCVVAARAGIVESVDATRIVVRAEGEGAEVPDIYHLTKFQRSNQSTCYNQKPIVRTGEHGEGRATCSPTVPRCDMGELALGQNVLVAFMPWQGYNFEDSILVSERIAKDDVFTSIHIEEFECVARDTKLGKEEITRDIPNVGEEALKDLDESGIVRIGAEVKPGDILVGKITPKGETPALPRREAPPRHLRREGRRRPRQLAQGPAGRRRHRHQRPHLLAQGHGEGRARHATSRTRSAPASSGRATRRSRSSATRSSASITRDPHRQDDDRQARRRQGQGPPPEGREPSTRRARRDPAQVLGRDPGRGRRGGRSRCSRDLEEIVRAREEHFRDKIDRLSKGDELPPGVIKMVKVYIAIKRKLQVGDKMAGRHGNKGVVSRILPEEDMPYLAGRHARSTSCSTRSACRAA